MIKTFFFCNMRDLMTFSYAPQCYMLIAHLMIERYRAVRVRICVYFISLMRCGTTHVICYSCSKLIHTTLYTYTCECGVLFIYKYILCP